MNIDAVIYFKDGTQEHKCMAGWEEFTLYIMRHHGEYTGFTAHAVEEAEKNSLPANEYS